MEPDREDRDPKQAAAVVAVVAVVAVAADVVAGAAPVPGATASAPVAGRKCRTSPVCPVSNRSAPSAAAP
jgi:hypothetical protein